jgi:hypothetical protein
MVYRRCRGGNVLVVDGLDGDFRRQPLAYAAISLTGHPVGNTAGAELGEHPSPP